MEKPVRIKIFDHEYLIKSDVDEDQVRNIAQFVNEKFNEVRESSADAISEGKTAILAAFYIASDYFQILQERDSLEKEIQDRSKKLNSRIDSARI